MIMILNDKKYKDKDTFKADLESEYVKIESKLAELAEQDAKSSTKMVRTQQLQDKAVLEGLTDDEKKEYKELRGL